MHPLLNPQTHADLELCARELAMSHLYPESLDSSALYVRMLLGTTMGLTIFESNLGVSVQQGKTVVERVLIERVLQRNDIKLTVISHDPAVGRQIEFTQGGRKLGMVLLQVKDVPSPDLLDDYSLMKGVRTHLGHWFPHKIYLKTELPDVPATGPGSEHPLLPVVKEHASTKSRIPVTTADQLKAPREPRKMALAENSKKLLDWQNGVADLSAEDPSEWDKHLTELEGFAFLTEPQKDEQFAELVRVAASYGVGYDNETKAFFLAEVQQLDA